MKKLILLALFALTLPAIAELDGLPRGLTQTNKQGKQIDLDKIKERGFLRVLTRNNPSCYFMHRGQLMGFEYEIMQLFAKKHGLEIMIIVPENWNDMGSWLQEGRADVIAATVTITPNRWKNRENLRFCHYYGKVYEQIIARTDEHSIQSLKDLKGRTIHVRKTSSYYESLTNLQKQKRLDFNIAIVPESEETFVSMKKVANGEYDLTCADHNILGQSAQLSKRIKPVLKLNRPHSYGWVVRKNQPLLRGAINSFFEKEINSSDFELIYKRYFELSRQKNLQSNSEPELGHISPYDDLVKKHAATYDFPWTLICSQMFQESSFRPDAVSWSGAQGLMQLMPATAGEVGVKNPFDPDDNIRGGTYYLKKQYRRVPDNVDSLNTTCFALASYNGGYGHLIDARNLAKKIGKDPNIWSDNVDQAYALLSEPYYAKRAKYGYCRSEEIIEYVQKIISRYIAYETAITTSPIK